MKITSYKDKSGRTLYKFCVHIAMDPLTGKRIKTNRQGFKTKKEAELAYVMLKNQKEQMNKPKKYTFEEVYKICLEEYKKTVSGATLRNTKRIFENHVLPQIGAFFIGKIDLTIAQNAVNAWSQKAQTYKSFKRYAEKVMKHAIKLELIEKNPFEHVTMPKSTGQNQIS